MQEEGIEIDLFWAREKHRHISVERVLLRGSLTLLSARAGIFYVHHEV